MGTIRTKIYDLDKRHKNHEDVPGGCFGTYYRVSPTVGLKLFNTEPAFSVPELTRSAAWRTSRREYNLLKLAAPSGFTPKPYNMVAVKYRTEEFPFAYKFQPGIMMQHINGVEDDFGCAGEDLAKELYKRFKIEHRDYSGHNVMAELTSTSKVKKYWLIDFSPCTTYRRKK